MNTVLETVKISGKTLMTGKECEVIVCPSETKGIRFYLGENPTPVVADANSVISTDNCTVIGGSNAAIGLIEHFMAACAFANIDSLDVYTDFQELPILDGSAAGWLKLFHDTGIKQEELEPSTVVFKEPLFIKSGSATLSIIPDETLKVTYCVDFAHPDLKNRWYSFDLSQDKNQIIEARTFGYLKDLEKFQSMGMALGVTAENTVGLTETGYTTELRSEFEPIKHKILDLIGDLYLTGLNPLNFKAHIFAREAGHKTHVELAKLIKNSYGESELCQKQKQ